MMLRILRRSYSPCAPLHSPARLHQPPRVLPPLFESAFPARGFAAAHHCTDSGSGRYADQHISTTLARAEMITKMVRGIRCRRTEEGGICKTYLVGAWHGTEASCLLVRTAVSSFKPPVVFLELCPRRASLLTEPNEMSAADQEAKVYGARVILGDQPIEVTYKRIAEVLRPDKKKWEEYITWSNGRLPDFENPEELSMCWEKEFPNVTKVMFEKRDRYMASEMISKIIPFHSSVMAVVGAAHIRRLLLNLEKVRY